MDCVVHCSLLKYAVVFIPEGDRNLASCLTNSPEGGKGGPESLATAREQKVEQPVHNLVETD